MIVLECQSERGISQNEYNLIVYSQNINTLICPSCKMKDIKKYNGFYPRLIKTNGETIQLKIQKVLCKCGRSHALMISSIVKNSIISKKDQDLIIKLYEKKMKYEKIAEIVNVETYNVNDVIRRHRKRQNI